ncbi:Retrotransposon gag protein [Corchorus olitorius]|uniref:Retrotransposon gag protein n=1 Tax=Corchorus olitorius TaxID=93759 RepID=A0A1R3KCP5_9ROSI|nr:Retrotransposon gag protein [Corchorus olitorius]
MPPRRAPERGRGRGRPPLQRLPHRLPEDAEEESSVHSSPTNENINVDPPPPPQWQQVSPPPYSDRVKIASRLLDEDAEAWWVSVKDRVGGPVTWENFLSEFNKEYYSKFEKGRISGEFLALKQGDMSVSEYDNKLRRLFRHMPGANEDLLCARFANGLAIDLQSSISSLIIDTTRTVPYSHLVDTAKQAELVSQAARKTKQKSGFFSRFFKGKGKRQDSDSSFEPFQKRVVVQAHRMGALMVALLVPPRHRGLANLSRGLVLIISLQGEVVFVGIAATTTMDLARYLLSVFSAVVGITFVGIARIGRAPRLKQIGVEGTLILVVILLLPT